MLAAGIDVGSTTTKAVILGDDGIRSAALISSGTSQRASALKCLETALKQAGFSREDLDLIASTGHGRKSIDFSHIEKPEITATAAGAFWLEPGTRLVIDIGGQGIRIVHLAPDGSIEKFVTNDKCSAGTGCFLDTLAFAMEVDLEDLGGLSAQAKTVCNISTTCTIFAESEMVSLVARGTPKEDIIAGLHESVVKKVSTMISGFKVQTGFFFCGGVARNDGVVKAFRSRYPDISVPNRPQLVTALGAALAARTAGVGQK